MEPNQIKQLIALEAASLGITRIAARGVIAEEMGVSPGTLENLERGRLKFIDRIRGKLDAYLVGRARREVRRLAAELEAHRGSDRDQPQSDIAAAEVFLEAARAILRDQ